MAKSGLIKVKIDDLDSDEILLRNDFEVNEKSIREENRRDRKDIVTHFLAGMIIISFLIFVFINLIYKTELPNYFISIVSMVVGFYFAKELGK